MAKSLFDKTYIGKMKLKNRIFMSPMGTTGEADGAYCNEGIDYFEERAKGGAGLIITGANVVSISSMITSPAIFVEFPIIHPLPTIVS